MKTYDAIVIGAGPGGYVCAISMAKEGLKVALIDKHRVGGTCLNYGCIPTKVLYHYAKLIHDINRQTGQGIVIEGLKIDFEAIMRHKNEAVDSLVNGVTTLIKKNGIDYYHGSAKFMNDHDVCIARDDGAETIRGEQVVIAVGAGPTIPRIEGLAYPTVQGRIMTSREALELKEVPESLLVVGGGVIGMELATVYAAFGCSVTVIEAADMILPSFDADLVKRYKAMVKKQGIQIITKAEVRCISEKGDSAEVVYETKKGGKTLKAQKILISTGRKPSFENLGLQSLSRKIDDGRRIAVDLTMRTSISHIFAVGDVNGISLLAHSASKQGIIAGRQIAGMDVKPFVSHSIPQVAFLLPELAQVDCPNKESDASLKQGRFNYRSSGMAMAMQATDGLCKVEYDADQEHLTYMGILGEGASELIHAGVFGIDHGLNYEGLADSIMAHPSLHEIIHEAFLDIKGKSIHQL